jgi:hypothetical protein
MKRISYTLLLLLSTLSISITAVAQQDSLHLPRGTRNYGYIIKPDGDTIPGYTLNLNLWNNQMMTYYYETIKKEDKGTKYRAKELLGFKTGPREYERLKYAGLFSPYKYNFFLKKIDGAIDLFIWYYNTDVNLLMGTDALLTEAKDSFLIVEDKLWTQLIGRTEKGEIVEFGSLKFKPKFSKKMSRLVSDYTELADKIRNEQEGYRFKDLEKIIQEYNSWKTRQ